MAGLAFPLWITVSVLLGTLANSAVNKGWRGVVETIVAFSGGASAWIALAGFKLSLQTDGPTTLFCIVGLTGYLLAVGNLGFTRNFQLRVTREKLRLRERELLTANETLQRNLEEIHELQEQLKEQANRDSLTGLYNRRFLDSTLERELARCKREGQSLSLIMLDVDHFKKYNDRYGHQAGDECLRSVAHTLQANAKRASDLAARYGGEEFSLVLADTSGTVAQRLAESVRGAIEALNISHEHTREGRVTVSVGVASMTQQAYQDVESLMRAADEALYRAKQGGRNRIEVAPDVPPRVGGAIAADFVQLVWHSTYESGHMAIDDQHQALFGHTNLLLATILSGHPTGEVVALIDTLIRAVELHFRDEEAIIAEAGFPGAMEHAAIHRELLDRATNMAARYQSASTGLGELFQFLAHDLVARHILGTDRKFFAYLEAGS
jgi:diguanylate cyclase (GGDEF)-like protein/hemerythrin-like metal-binding protein